MAARRKKKAITMPDIEEAAMKVLVGTEKKSHRMTERDKKLPHITRQVMPLPRIILSIRIL